MPSIFSIPAACSRASDAHSFPRRAIERPAYEGCGEGAAHLRALRLLHGDMPDLSRVGRRAGFAARTHHADAAYVGKRGATDRRNGEASRSMPFLSGLPNGMSLGRRLRGTDRSVARPYRDALSAAFIGAGVPLFHPLRA